MIFNILETINYSLDEAHLSLELFAHVGKFPCVPTTHNNCNTMVEFETLQTIVTQKAKNVNYYPVPYSRKVG